jgi:hypothetical protein
MKFIPVPRAAKHIMILLLAGAGLFPLSSNAQLTKVMGKVVDSATGEPIPFANVYFQGTTVGVTSNFEGGFAIETARASDTLVASFVGYHKSLVPIRKGRFNELRIALVSQNIELSEVVILPGENPAEVLLKRVIANKQYNNREEYDAYSYEAYTKIQFDANNITEEFKNRAIFKQFQFIFDNVDTSTINGKSYLPIFLTETISDIYFRKSPRSQKEVIRANIMSGIKNESITKFLGDIAQKLNIYDNYLMVFQKNFVSPVANFGLGYYRYYLVDSLFIDDDWCYEIKFRPRRVQEPTFIGQFWVEKETAAIKKVDMRISADANVNFINDMTLTQEFDRMESNYWMLTMEKIVADFNITENNKSTMGFFGHKTSSYKNFSFTGQEGLKVHSSPVNVIVDEAGIEKDSAYWAEMRHDSLTRDEKTIYQMIDTLQTIPVFNTYVDIVKMITTGYYVKGMFEWGPYMSFISFNSLEGVRLRVGGRTSNDFSTRIMLDGHIAYGTKDRDFKYGAGFIYMFDKNPRRTLQGSYYHDIEQLGQSQNAFREDFLLASLFRRNPADKLSIVDQFKMTYEREWFNGFTNTVHFIRRDLRATANQAFYVNDGTELKPLTTISTTEIRLDTRLAYKEDFLMGEFERVSLGAKYPILEIIYGLGVENALGSQYGYHRMQLQLRHWFNIGAIGWSKYIVETGRIFGELPYPLLKIHEGNETYSFDEYAYNMMDYYEFISDQYLSFYYTHHFLGFFFKRVPLFRELKWREVAYFKGLVGGLANENVAYAELPEGVYELSKPYIEIGVGIENIFTIVRIDAVWRLSYLDHPGAKALGIRASLQFDF